MNPSPASAPPTTGRVLPGSGVLTFLFTDVEGSTPLWERHEAVMRAVTARHDALLDRIISEHGGTRVRERGEGDSLFAVFTDAMSAVSAALAMAVAVQAEPWPAETPIRVRMGLHSGAAQLRAGDYYGPVVNRCARIRGLGHGHQVLLSATTAALAREALPEGASLRSLGAHTLKGLSEPEEVYQLCHPDLPSEFPPLLSPQAPRHNLPQALSSLIGREAEQGAVLALLAEARLVTLMGSGGVGKTRLALAVAAEVVDHYADGVWLIELASLGEPELVPGAVAQALGVREEPGRALHATLADYLREKRLLLVLDNCEHLVAACAALVGALLRACPHLRILATSREGLEVSGERHWRVPSLTVPNPKHLPSPELAGSYEAVRLFVTRARERRADFALNEGNARAVASICARLDGIPLAIELAAARVGSLSAEGIAARLDDRFRLLTGGARDVLPRQRTLRAALDWSYDLLGESEQHLLARLSVFAGGWTLDAAEAVCAGEGVEQWEVLDLLGSLANKSLLQAEEIGSGSRYRLLETVRQYGQDRLAAVGGAAAVRDRHMGWCLALAEEAALGLVGGEQAAWLERLETEHDNLRAALSWTQESGAAEEGLRLAGALVRFWDYRGHPREGLNWLEGALARASATDALAARCAALSGAGLLAYRLGDLERATMLHGEAMALYRTQDDPRGTANSLTNLGLVIEMQGDYGRATALHEEALALYRTLEDTQGIARSLTNLGNVAIRQGAYERAAPLHEESLAKRRELGDQYGIAWSLSNLGAVAIIRGDYGRAAALHEEALALHRELGHDYGVACCLANLGTAAYRQGEHGRAALLYTQALQIGRTIGALDLLAEVLESMAWVAAAREQAEPAARLGGAAETLRATLGAPLEAIWREDHERAVRTMRAALGEVSFLTAWDQGRALAPDEAVTLAVAGRAASLEMRRGVVGRVGVGGSSA